MTSLTKRQPTALRTLSVLLAIALSACGSDDPNGGDGGGGGGTGGAGGSKCEQSSGGGLGIDLKADLQVFESSQEVQTGDTLVVATAGLATGASTESVLTLRHVAQKDASKELLVNKIEVLYTKPENATDAAKVFECLVDVDGTDVPCADAGQLSIVPDGAAADFCVTGKRTSKLDIKVRFYQQGDNIVRQAVVRVVAVGDDAYADKAFTAKLTTKQGAPKIKLSPDLIDFGVVKVNGSETKKLTVLNTGDAPLLVDKLEIAMNLPKPISVEVEGKTFQGGTIATLDPPMTVAPQQSGTILVTFSATGSEGFIDVIKVHSNDAESPHQAKLVANQNVPCLKVIPEKSVNFGFIPLGTEGSRTLRLESCGGADAVVTDLSVLEDKNGIFKVDYTSVAELGGKPVSADNPITLKTNGSVEVKLVCTPEAEYEDPTTGKPAPYTAQIGLADNTAQPDKNVALSCWGTKTNCPTAVIVPQEGEEIVPQSTLNLIGSQSFAGPNQKVEKWQWKVVKMPAGAEANHKFWPNANAPDVQFGAKTLTKDFSGAEVEVISINIAGEYVFELNVIDDAGNEACAKAVQTILVIPDEDIHVELLWTTPGDNDKDDAGLGAGADMDLHFTHHLALNSKICTNPPEICPNGKPCNCLQDLDKDGKPDPFFHNLYDCFWFNANPNWASTDPTVPDNPGLDLDDTDGWGPENLNLKLAETGTQYTVGVHYWDAHSFGSSVATVRIYISGVLKGEFVSESMDQCDLWWVKKIDWPSGDLVDIESGKTNGKMTKKYFPNFSKTLGAKCSD